MADIAFLSLFRQQEIYISSLAYPTKSALHPHQFFHTPKCVGGSSLLDGDLREQLNGAIAMVVDRLQKRSGHQRSKRDVEASASLERLGQFMFRHLLPREVQNALSALPAKMPILLTTNDIDTPWELLHDGRDYLALKHPIGRCLSNTTPVRRNTMPERIQRSFLFIANPTGDLPQASHETEEIMDSFDPEVSSGASLKFLARSRATKWEILQALGKHHDIIHYAGHAQPGRLLLADGELSAEEIQKTLQGWPFVFLNACWSVKEEANLSGALQLPSREGSSRSLAEAFIMGGAAGFIGTLWPVVDLSSRQFAEWFYSNVRHGIPVGEALRLTRQRMIEEQPDDPIWVSFVLYGDPMLTIATPRVREIRWVTVLVVRLVGLFRLFERLPLEAAVERQEEAINLLRQLSERYNGQVHAFSTDTLHVHFGVPVAHGDDAEHAIHAALGMKREFHAFNQRLSKGLSVRLAMRVGISTGHVLVKGSGTDYQIAGQVESMAAFLSAQAAAGQIVVDQATSQAIGEQFTLQSLPPLTMTNEPPPQHWGGKRGGTCYRVIGTQAVATAATPIVGRENDLSELHRFWHRARKGRGEVVAIVGDPGVGKTRLVQAFREEITSDPQWISATCHSYDKSQSYGLLAQVIYGLASISPHDDEATRRRKLEEIVRGTRPPLFPPPTLGGGGSQSEARFKKRVALLGPVVGLSFAEGVLEPFSLEQRQDELKRAVVELLKSQAAEKPIVLVLEDLQWADETSLALLELVIRNASRMAVLLLAIYRSDWSHGWSQRLVKIMRLEELEADGQRALLANLLGQVELEALSQSILKQTGGNPLFIEQYVRLLQENELLIRVGDSWVTTDLTQVPALNNVESVIQARLDRLQPSSREVLQRAAVIGQTFENKVLRKIQEQMTSQFDLSTLISELTDRNLIEELDEWETITELIKRRVIAGEEEWEEEDQWYDLLFYAFRHGLVHQIAYRLFPEPLRQFIHRLVGEALRWVYKNDEAKILYQLAHHYDRSNDRVNAIDYSLRAAKEDADKWAKQGALDWYDRALEKIQSFETTPLSEAEQAKGTTPFQLLEWHLEALSGKGDVEALSGKWEGALEYYLPAEILSSEEGFSAPQRADLMRRIGRQYGWSGQFDQALEWMERGRNLLEPEGDDAERQLLALIEIHSASIFYQKGEFEQVETLCQQALNLLGQEGDSAARAEGYNLLGTGQDRQGKYQEALVSYDKSIELWKGLANEYQVKRVENNVAITYSLLGDWEPACEVYHQLLVFFDHKAQNRNQLALICTNLGLLEYLLGDYDVSAKRQERAMKLADEIGVPWLRVLPRVNLAWVQLAWSEWEKADFLTNESINIQKAHFINNQLPESYRLLAQVAIGRGQLDLAHQHALQALELAAKQKDRLEEGTAERIVGQALRLAGDFQFAVTHLKRSLKLLESPGNRFEAARTVRELAWLSRDMGEESMAFSHAIRALTVFVELGAQGEAREMQAENKLTFHLQQPLNQASAFCQAEMLAAGWTETSSDKAPASATSNEKRITLNFMRKSHQALISLAADMAETMATMRMQ